MNCRGMTAGMSAVGLLQNAIRDDASLVHRLMFAPSAPVPTLADTVTKDGGSHYPHFR